MLRFSIKAICLAVAAFSFQAPAQAQTSSYDYLLLAASWQPGFCATHSGKPECQSLAGTWSASHFTLHGLWPNNHDGDHPFYCGVSQTQINLDKNNQWCSMANYGVSNSTLNTLKGVMPGVVSCLDKHEWYKHGTCEGRTADNYWQGASSLVQRLGNTSFTNFVAANVGKYVSRSQLLNAFNSAIGADASKALYLQCTKANSISYLTEAWIAIKTDQQASFPQLNSLALDASLNGTCPSQKIFIAKAQ